MEEEEGLRVGESGLGEMRNPHELSECMKKQAIYFGRGGKEIFKRL
jgi:hypothetical protein